MCVWGELHVTYLPSLSEQTADKDKETKGTPNDK